MSRPTAINNLCTKKETQIAAKELLQLAQTKTGPGSGFNMPYSNALPAVCAFIASERLQNNDVKRNEAQAASCLKSTDFNKCYRIVQTATEDEQKGKKKQPTARTSSRTSSNNFYDMFIINSAIPGPKSMIIEWVNKAEKLLSLDERVFDPSNVAAKHAVFLWVYKNVQQSHADLCLSNDFAKKNNIDITNPTTAETLDFLNNCLTTIPATIAEELGRVRQGGPAKLITTIVSPRKSPTKQPLREPPTKGSPQKRRILDVEDFPGPTPGTPSKRPKLDDAPGSPRKKLASSSNVTLDDAPGSPRKKSGLTTPIGSPKKSSLAVAGQISPKKTVKFPSLTPARTEPQTPQKNRNIAMDSSPTRRGHVLALNPMDVDEEAEEEAQPTKRLRPVFQDHVEWTTRDARVEALIRRGEAAKQKMMKVYGDPLAELRIAMK